jgi:hypothetical protein
MKAYGGLDIQSHILYVHLFKKMNSHPRDIAYRSCLLIVGDVI